ncbi:MAG TPA: alpha-hydroxy acid oxidase [Solirubrobacteraceae bacterium]|nr:alpha-hydroxy acid oxidase [Solirubrobacteraceae bacterium]
MTLPSTIGEFERVAQESLAPGPLAYYDGGACDELTLADNLAAWRRLAIRPRMLVGVAERDCSTTLLGREREHPLIVAPMAFQAMAAPEGERATARAAAATATPFCLSTLATVGVQELAAAAPDATRWFQLYVFRDRGVTRELVAAAGEHGYEALVVTVDLPVFGVRDSLLRTGWTVDPELAVPSASAAGTRGPIGPAEVSELIDPSLDWSDIERFVAETDLPVVLKGILTAEDARRAAACGVAAIVVSNHGGRQLDTVLSGADALPAVVEEVSAQLDVLVDGGIRRGTDVLKALALGASAVLVGRPLLWGLAVAGEQGARRVLELLLGELDVALALAGAPNARELDASWLMPAPWASH